MTVTFGADAAAYRCNCSAEPHPSCMSAWNKLWGSSRCGFAHLHHEDSDRFVWRRQMLPDGVTPGDAIELAADSYDACVNPYSPNLLQPFSTVLAPGVGYGLALDLSDAAATVFALVAPPPDGSGGGITEKKTVAVFWWAEPRALDRLGLLR